MLQKICQNLTSNKTNIPLKYHRSLVKLYIVLLYIIEEYICLLFSFRFSQRHASCVNTRQRTKMYVRLRIEQKRGVLINVRSKNRSIEPQQCYQSNFSKQSMDLLRTGLRHSNYINKLSRLGTREDR